MGFGAPVKTTNHTIGQWLTGRAALTPDRVAIDFLERRITYSELLAGAKCREQNLIETGTTPGSRIAILARNCPEQVELFFACAMSGMIMVPLNWRLTAPELAFQLEDCGATILLVQSELTGLANATLELCSTPPSMVFLGPQPGPPDKRRLEKLSPKSAGSSHEVHDDDPLLIIYTSGTTGRPKGAVLTHSNCFWTNLSLDRTAEISSDDVVLQVLPQCHVAGWNVQPLLAWWKGAKVVLEEGFDAERVLKVIGTRGITTMMGVPTTYLMMAEHPDFANADLSSLRQLIVGGAPMPKPLLEEWISRGVTVLQGYGLTEAAPNVLCVPFEYARAKLGSAGKPYLHVEVALRKLSTDANESLTPGANLKDQPMELVYGPGTGELLVRGPNVFDRYWNNPKATAATLREGWLVTGDVVEVDSDGFYWIRGRLKEMYISGGENVYPAEVAAVLATHEGVADAAVIGVPHQRWGETGYAFVVPHQNSSVTAELLRAYCRTRLGAYKIPSYFAFVEELPRLSTGKLDRQSLEKQIPNQLLPQPHQ